ncbi:MAG: prephenate dehydratase [Dehalococcoidales bacterium]|nr:prephenate dehydratase [Dehalococcoidales bacterium]
MSLEEMRKNIDEVDDKIVRLIAERVRQSKSIGKEKHKSGKPIEDANREEKVLAHIRGIAREEKLDEKETEAIYRQIIKSSKSVQGIVVAFQGEIGAYSEEAAFQHFGQSVSAKPCESFDDVFKLVEKGEAPYGVVPIENSLEGSINRVYDLLLNSNLKVCGELELRIVHCLISHPEASLDTIKRVYSHPQALGQCQTFLRHLNWELVPTYDTAGSVKLIKEQNITDGAAIASARAAEIYGMKILAREIEDNPNNFTRFFILAKQDSPPTGKDKTSVVFSVKHKPGALYGAVKEFADSRLNLTKIESRPTRQKAWEYNFYLDFEGHHQDKAVKDTLERLEEHTLFLKVLGSYPRAM